MNLDLTSVASIYHVKAQREQNSVAVLNQALTSGALPTRKQLFQRALPIAGNLLLEQAQSMIQPFVNLLCLARLATLSRKQFIPFSQRCDRTAQPEYNPLVKQVSLDVGFGVLKFFSTTLFNTLKVASFVLGFAAPRLCVTGWKMTEQLTIKIDTWRAHYFSEHGSFDIRPFKNNYPAAKLLLGKPLSVRLYEAAFIEQKRKMQPDLIHRLTTYLEGAVASGKLNLQTARFETRPTLSGTGMYDNSSDHSRYNDQNRKSCQTFLTKPGHLKDVIKLYFDLNQEEELHQAISGLMIISYKDKDLYEELGKFAKELAQYIPKRWIHYIYVPALTPLYAAM
jgi:muconolactone delta-isomerase